MGTVIFAPACVLSRPALLADLARTPLGASEIASYVGKCRLEAAANRSQQRHDCECDHRSYQGVFYCCNAFLIPEQARDYMQHLLCPFSIGDDGW